jgi:hypothetical protein
LGRKRKRREGNVAGNGTEEGGIIREREDRRKRGDRRERER